MCAISTSSMCVTSMPSTCTLPDVTRVLPLMTSHRVVFPAPLGPMTTRSSFRSTEKELMFSALKPSKDTTTSLTATIGPAMGVSEGASISSPSLRAGGQNGGFVGRIAGHDIESPRGKTLGGGATIQPVQRRRHSKDKQEQPVFRHQSQRLELVSLQESRRESQGFGADKERHSRQRESGKGGSPESLSGGNLSFHRIPKSGKSIGKKQYHGYRDEAFDQKPYGCHIGTERRPRHAQQQRAKDSSPKLSAAAKGNHHHHDDRRVDIHILRRNNSDLRRIEHASQSRQHRPDGKSKDLKGIRLIAGEIETRLLVAHRDQHATEPRFNDGLTE